MRKFCRYACVGLLALAAPCMAVAEVGNTTIYRADAFRDVGMHDTTFRPVTHRIELRFGMSYNSDRGMEPGYDARYTVTFNHQLDNGWQVGVSLGVSLDNLNSPSPWRDRGLARY